MEYYTICSSDKDAVGMDAMPSRFVDVKKFPGEGRFWRGSEIELQLWEEAKKRKAKKPSKKTGEKTKTQTEQKEGQKRPESKTLAKTQTKFAEAQSLGDDEACNFSIDKVKLHQLHKFSDEGDEGDQQRKDDSSDLPDITLLWDSLECLGEGEEEADADAPALDAPDTEDAADLPFADLYGELFKEFAQGETEWDDQDENIAINVTVEGIPDEPCEPAAAAPYDPDVAADHHEIPREKQEDDKMLAELIPAEDRKDRKQEAAPRKAKVPEIVFMIPKGLGALRFNSVGNFMRAHCPYHEKCTRQRQTTAGRFGAGRPIGALLAWLEEGAKTKDRTHHMAVSTPSFSVRSTARETFYTWAGAKEFSANERAKYSSESGDEPARIP